MIQSSKNHEKHLKSFMFFFMTLLFDYLCNAAERGILMNSTSLSSEDLMDAIIHTLLRKRCIALIVSKYLQLASR